MRHAIGVAFIVSGLLVLAACGSDGVTPTVKVTATAMRVIQAGVPSLWLISA
jgi:hypothetical protein